MKKKKLELTKLTNRELMESAFKMIESLGFHIVDKFYNDTYFFFEGEEDSICEFHIKEIPRFRFAFWKVTRLEDLKKQLENGDILWTDTYKVRSMTELLFFTQYERDLDKFKPSRSGFLTGLYRETWIEGKDNSDETQQVEEWNTFEIEGVLKFMKKHPIKSFAYSGFQIREIYEEINGLKCMSIFLRDWFYDKKWKIKHWLELRSYIQASIKLARKVRNNYNVLVVQRSQGCYPQIAIIVRRMKDFNYEECCKQEKLFVDFDEKWFNAIDLDQYDLELSENTMSEAEKQSDEELENRFIKRLTYIYADNTENADTILWCNCEELINVKAMKES